MIGRGLLEVGFHVSTLTFLTNAAGSEKFPHQQNGRRYHD